MGVMIEKVKAEVFGFGQAIKDNLREIFVDNRPRYRNPKEWLHLWVDLFVSVIAVIKAAIMPYTYGHILAVAAPLLLILS